jgi:transcriptional regulator with XRE-family HTH domain
MSQEQLARIAGVTQQLVSLAELGDATVSLDVRCRMAAACGHELGWRLHPVATVRLRDSGQLNIAQEIVRQVHARWQARLEVPVAAGDARAADLLLSGREEIIHLEIERALVDFQAQLRSAQLKRAELTRSERRPIRLVLAVPDTSAARVRLAPFAQLISQALPRTSRQIGRALRYGEPLGGDGILFVRARRRG